jgi:hypothetical protein
VIGAPAVTSTAFSAATDVASASGSAKAGTSTSRRAASDVP